MIDFKHRENAASIGMVVISILLLVGCVLFKFFVPSPNVAETDKLKSNRLNLEKEISKTNTQTAQKQADISHGLYHEDTEAVTSDILRRVTDVASSHGLKVADFRPQRPQTLNGMMELPFNVRLTGSFNAVRDVLTTFDAKGSKIAVRSVQTSSTDSAKSAITAALSFSTYVVDATNTKIGMATK